MSTTLRLFAPALLVAVGLAALIGCGGSTSTPTPPSAEPLRDQTVAALRALSSASFQVSHADDLGTDLGGGVTLLEAEGEALFPDRAKLEAKVLASGFGLSLNMEIVQIGPDTFIKDPINSSWGVVPGGLPFDFVGMHESLADALASVTSLTTVTPGGESGTWFFNGTVVAGAFRGIVPSALATEPLSLGLTVRQADSLPVEVSLEGRLIEADPPEMIRYLTLPRYNHDVTVEPPI